MDQNTSPMPIPAANSIAVQDSQPNSGFSSSAPSRTEPQWPSAKTTHMMSAAETTAP